MTDSKRVAVDSKTTRPKKYQKSETNSSNEPMEIEKRMIRVNDSTSKVLSSYHIPITLTNDEIKQRNIQWEGPWGHNVVSTAQFSVQPNTETFALSMGGSRYVKNGRTTSTSVRLSEPGCKITMYHKSGKVTLTGVRSESLALLAHMIYARYVGETTGVWEMPRNIRFHNVHATVYTGYTVDLNKLHAMICGSNFLEEVRALRFDLKNPNATILVFPTGSCVITGCQNEQMVNASSEAIRPILAHGFIGYNTKEQQKRHKEEIVKQTRLLEKVQKFHDKKASTKRKCKEYAALVAKTKANMERMLAEADGDDAEGEGDVEKTKSRKLLMKKSFRIKPLALTKTERDSLLGLSRIQVGRKCIRVKSAASVKPCKHTISVCFGDSEEEFISLGVMTVDVINEILKNNGMQIGTHDYVDGYAM